MYKQRIQMGKKAKGYKGTRDIGSSKNWRRQKNKLVESEVVVWVCRQV
jgi:hypothetical protein